MGKFFDTGTSVIILWKLKRIYQLKFWSRYFSMHHLLKLKLISFNNIFENIEEVRYSTNLSTQSKFSGLDNFYSIFNLGLIHAWITSQVFRNYCELSWITLNYCELLELLGITLNYLDFLLYFLTRLLIFQLGYLNFLTGLCLLCFFFGFLPHIFINYWIIIIFFCWVIIISLGHLGISTGFCWGYIFWQLICSELLWIAVNYSELLWIAGITLNYIELLHYLTAVEGNINPCLQLRKPVLSLKSGFVSLFMSDMTTTIKKDQ
jgi:hypothetical protein